MKKNVIKMVANWLMLVIATMFGGGVAMATSTDSGAIDVDPDATSLEDATKDVPEMGTDQQGHAATGSALDEEGLGEDQINDYVMRYNAWKYPFHTDIMNLAQKRMVKTKHPKHPVIGEAILECYTTGTSTEGEQAELPVSTSDMKLFQTRSTVRVFGMPGYDEAGNANGSCLMLYVVNNERNTKVTVKAVNGPHDEGGTVVVPAIASGTKLRVMASACEEDVYDVAPDNFMPGWRQAYLQRKVCAITKTDFYEKMKKKVQGIGQLQKDIALDTFRKKCTSTALMGALGKTKVYNDVTKTELDCYFQEGVITQIPGSYQLSGIPTVEDLIAITRLSFTKFAKTNRAQGYCGSIFMEWLANMDFSKHPEIQFTSKRDALGVKVGYFESNFGTIEWKLDYAMDENGMARNAMILPMEKAVRYVYEESVQNQDNKDKKINAKSQYHVIEDCIELTGLTALFVGQDVSAAGARTGTYEANFVSVTALPTGSDIDSNKVYYLTKSDSTHLIGAYKYNETKSAWEQYNGNLAA